MKRYLLIVFSLVTVLMANAAEVSTEKAREIAKSFMMNRGKTAMMKYVAPRKASAKRQPFYIFNAEDNGGFVIVAGNDNIGTVIAYSDNGSISIDEAPEGLRDILTMYETLMSSSATATLANDAPEVVVKPLLGDIAWTQEAPFNNYCPTYTQSGANKHYYVGCVATAMAQIMRYYKYPTQGSGTKTYKSNIGDLTADFGSTVYDWSSMPEQVSSSATPAQEDALATLCQHVGISVEMTYEAAGSGAYSQYVAGALKNYFGYANSTAYIARNYYSSSEWMAILKNELDAGRPVFYSASSDAGTGGHAFVADGYDSNDFVHINWGWGGKSNGYFMINALNPNDLGIGGGTGGYNLSQEMVIGIEPMKEGLADGNAAIFSPTRMAGVDYGESFQLMSYVENDDTEDFNGILGGALVKDGEIVKILQTMPLSLNAVTQTSRINIDSRYIKMEDVPKSVADVENGEYELRYAVKNGDNEWFVLRHPQGLPAYLDARVSNGYLSALTHEMKPEATLLSKIEPDGDVYANGVARFTVAVRNDSHEMPLSALRLMFTPVDGGESFILADKLGSQKIYDESEKTLTMLCDMPEELAAGEYRVDVIENKFEEYPFDCKEVGETHIMVLPESESPVIRRNSTFVWTAANGGDVHQSETFVAMAAMRNYAAEGNVNLLLKLKTEDDIEIPFFLINKTFAKGEVYNAQFARRLDVDPGIYELKGYYITEDGTEHEMVDNEETAMFEVVQNPDIAVECEELTLPAEIVQGSKTACSIRLHALKDFNRTIYIRLRQYTNTKGEIVYMKSGLSMKAGDVTTLEFNYKPGIECGAYFPIIETKVDSSTYEAVGGFINYHKDYHVVEASAIISVDADNECSTNNVIYTITGQRAEKMQKGVYIVAGKKVLKH